MNEPDDEQAAVEAKQIAEQIRNFAKHMQWAAHSYELDQRVMYEESKNPVHVWMVINLSLSSGRALPDWTLEYLKRAAGNIAATAEAAQHRNTCKDECDVATAKALEMHRGRKGHVFNDWARTQAKIRAVYEVVDAMQNGTKLQFAVEAVAKRHSLGVSTVGDAVRTAKKWIARQRQLIEKL